MYDFRWLAVACLSGSLVSLAGAAPPPAIDGEGLATVRSSNFEHVSLRPEADLASYTKVILEPTQVTFRSGWLKDMNRYRIAVLQGTTQEDADRVAAEVGTGLDATMRSAFERAPYEIVAAPAPGVLRVSPRIVDLYVNAPRSITTALPGAVYTLDAGNATLVLDVRDSISGQLLGHVVDARTVGDRGGFPSSLRSTTPPSNAFDFDRVFKSWALGSVKTFGGARSKPVASGTAAPPQ